MQLARVPDVGSCALQWLLQLMDREGMDARLPKPEALKSECPKLETFTDVVKESSGAFLTIFITIGTVPSS